MPLKFERLFQPCAKDGGGGPPVERDGGGGQFEEGGGDGRLHGGEDELAVLGGVELDVVELVEGLPLLLEGVHPVEQPEVAGVLAHFHFGGFHHCLQKRSVSIKHFYKHMANYKGSLSILL